MKQMSLIEMDGFLKGKCIPRGLKVNETNAEYLVRKFGELESKLETALRECRSAGITIDNLEAKCTALAAENAGLNKFIVQSCYVFDGEQGELSDAYICAIDGRMPQTTATDAFLAEVKTEARKEGAYFVANRMLAAWDAGFIDDTAKNAADIARMILTSTEFMANAPEGDFDRSFSDGVLEDIAAQLRKGASL
ncbi:TPA: hypothetical protein ACG2UD_001945 [Escherichia coli]